MGEKIKYQRLFLIFEEEDQGYGTSVKPSGYTKIEIKNGIARLVVFLQNLETISKETVYRLYFIKSGGNLTRHVLMGDVDLNGSNGQMSIDFDPDNIKNSGLCLNDFDIFAVGASVGNNRIVWPLCAYRNEKVIWKNHVANLIQTGNNQSNEVWSENNNSANIASKYNGDITSIYNIKNERLSDVTAFPSDSIEKDKNTEDVVIDKIETEETDAEENSIIEDKVETEVDGYEEPVYEDKRNEEGWQDSNITQDQGVDSDSGYPVRPFAEHKCTYLPNQQHCENCYLHDLKKTEKQLEIKKGDMNRLRDELDTYFERHCPFENRRKDYTWWKVNSPIYLNNILHQFDIKVSILFNPKVLMAHFKYRHLIAGIYKDKRTEKEYVVCGVPGAYRIDEKPFGNICRWVQVEGTQLRYGAFGYWLVYIDPISGKVLGT